jgi:two-component system OmpR family response regulator
MDRIALCRQRSPMLLRCHAVRARPSIKVLVVDDDEDILTMVARYLGAQNVQVLCASSPFGVSTTVKREKPDVVVLDVMMPALSGDQLAKLLASLDHRAPIVFYSAMDESELEALTRRVDGTRYVLKTAGLEALLATVLSAAAGATLSRR